MSFDLLFRRLRDPAARDIVFGQPIGPVTDANGRFVVTLPGVSLQLTARLEYDLAVSRSDMIGVMSAWGASDPVAPASTTAMHGNAIPVSTARTFRWRHAAPQAADCRVPWQKLTSIPSSRSTSWGSGKPVSAGSSAPWQPAAMLRNSARAPWQPAIPVSRAAASPWQVAVIVRRPGDRIRWGAGDPTPISITARATSAGPVAPVTVRLPWNAAEHLPPGRTVAIVVPPPEPWRCYTPPPGGAAHLLFDKRRTPGFDILFSCGAGTPAGTVVVPIRKTYIVINEILLLRLPDNTPLQAYSLSMSWDTDSWSVGWEAALHASALDAVMPESAGSPVELLARINGVSIRLLAESIGRDRSFGDQRIKVRGRGRAAWLASPYADTIARTNAEAATAQQLAEAALTVNGVGIGWNLDWQLADWLVPAGTWSHQGSHIDAVKRIAEAAGGYVVGHRSAQTLRALPRYPVLPWAWAGSDPDLIIPAAVATTESIEWVEKPAYNRVYVSGERAGILADVVRTGSAGDLAAQLVIDPLMTAIEAGRARGSAILADTGAQCVVTIQLPVLPETGIVDLGQLIEYNDGMQAYRGLVRSVRVSANFPTVVQQLEIETHA